MANNLSNIAYMTSKFDVQARLSDLARWDREFLDAQEYLRGTLSGLDPKKPTDIPKIAQVNSVGRTLSVKQVQHPLAVSPAHLRTAEGRLELTQLLAAQYTMLSREERIIWLNNLKFIVTPQVFELFSKLTRVREYRSFGQQRNFLLGGHSGSGKSTSFTWMSMQNAPVVEAERTLFPIVKIDAPIGNKSAKALLQRVLTACGASFQKRDSEEDLLQKVAYYFVRCQVEVLIIDEVEHLKSHELRRRVLEISNMTTRLPIICASPKPQRFVDDDEEIAGRWNDIFFLEPYKDDHLQALLTIVEFMLPFSQRSSLHQWEITIGKGKQTETFEGPASFIQKVTHGILRDVMVLIVDASKMAIEHGAPCLTIDHLRRAWSGIQHEAVSRLNDANEWE